MPSLARFGIEDYCVLKMDYQGGASSVIYPYAAYLVLDQFHDEMRNHLIEELNLDREDILELLKSNPYIVESEVLSRVYEIRGTEETCEIGYPEKFLSLLPAWHLNAVIRSGRWLLMKKFEDDEKDLIRSISGVEGQNANFFQAFASPRFRQRWAQTRADAAYCLNGNMVWAAAFNHFWSKSHAKTPKPRCRLTYSTL